MGANRRLQSEIDRTLKKVNEGIEIFDQIWDKVYDTDNMNQKEKYEGDLKKEIKKLQRYRDQIKTWISGSDIKDKAALVEARKAVERQMERFKVCEKETKTKAFSKEGLGQAAKLDPREKARTDMQKWLKDAVESLNGQVEEFEAEIEALQNTKRKAKPPPRLAHLEESVARHKQHIARLEQLLRLLDNEAVEPDDPELLNVKEMMEDYLDRNQEDFDSFDTPDDLYGDLLEQLEEVANAQPLTTALHVKGKDPKVAEADKEKDKQLERERHRERERAQVLKAQVAARGGIALPEDDGADKSPLARKSTDSKVAMLPMAATSSAPAPAASAAAPAAPAAAATATTAAAAAGTPSKPAVLAVPAPLAKLESGATTPTPASPAASSEAPGAPQPSLAAAVAVPLTQRQPSQVLEASAPTAPGARLFSQLAAEPSETQQLQSPAPLRPPGNWGLAAAVRPPAADQAVKGPSAAPAQQPEQAPQQGTSQAPPQPQLNGLPPISVGPPASSALQQPYAAAAGAGGAAAGIGQHGALGFMLGRPADGAQAQQQPGTSGEGPPAPAAAQSEEMSKTASEAFDAKAAGGLSSMAELSAVTNDIVAAGRADGQSRTPSPGLGLSMVSPAANLNLLQACASKSIPQAIDSTWQSNPVRMRLPPGGVPTSYPSTKMPILDNPALFEKLDTEALFFAFYYQPGTYQQWLAARELKRQSWRYHKQHGAWFQRHEEPKLANEEYEQGTYVYFDFHIRHDDQQDGWCYRLKQDFTFRYESLEDDLQ